MRTWILVGDSARARIFLQTGHRDPLVLLHDLHHPESRAKGTDLYTDQPRMENGLLPRELESQKFAHSVAELVSRELGSNKFDALVLVCPPNFLGMLRQQLPDTVKKKIVETQGKDLTHLKDHELVERLQTP